jgi:predicted transcriptional regulator
MTKETALQTVEKLPSEFELEELIEQLIFVDKIEKGLEQVKEGKIISHQKVRSSVKSWQKGNLD